MSKVDRCEWVVVLINAEADRQWGVFFGCYSFIVLLTNGALEAGFLDSVSVLIGEGLRRWFGVGRVVLVRCQSMRGAGEYVCLWGGLFR